MRQPKVSVIVPVYNSEKYLDVCLLSLIKQTLKEIEIVIINDGSTDHSEEIVKKYMYDYPEYITYRRKENGGQATARNLGIEICQGEYIGFLDSDDQALPHMFEYMYQKAIDTQADLVESDYRYIDSSQNIVIEKYAYTREHTNVSDMFIDPLVSPWNKLYRRDVIVKSGVRFLEGYVYEDTAFYINLIPHLEKVEYISEELILHYKHENTTMNGNQNKRVADIFHVVESIYGYYKKQGYLKQYEQELEYFIVKILLCSSFQRITWIRDTRLAKNILKQTWSMITSLTPHYRENNYMKNNARGFYMKSMNKYSIYLWFYAFRVFRKEEKHG